MKTKRDLIDGEIAKKRPKNIKAIIIIIAAVTILTLIIAGASSSRKIDHLRVTYDGDTQAGVVLNKDNKGIHVKGITKDGKEKDLRGWTVKEDKTLQEDSYVAITVLYKDLSKELKVECSSSAITDIYAEYTGDLSAGTTISASNGVISVFAMHKNGEETEITADCTFNPESITLKTDGKETVNIKYGDFACDIELVCSDKSIKEISAKYTGSTKAGTTINTNNANVEVTAVFVDGTKETVTGWTVENPVTLEADKESEIKITYKDKSCTLKVLCSTISDAAYKTKCESISYTELARSPKSYEGKHVKFTGSILQVMEDDILGMKYVTYRIATKWGYSQYIDDVVYVTYVMTEDSPRFLEDDTVTFYGEYEGLYTYKTVMGGSVTIPKVSAKVIELD